jgi:hypothetical protein
VQRYPARSAAKFRRYASAYLQESCAKRMDNT